MGVDNRLLAFVFGVEITGDRIQRVEFSKIYHP